MESSPHSNERYVYAQRPAPGHLLLDKFVEAEFRPQDRRQAALAFATAEKLRAQQRRLLKEQAELLDRANSYGYQAASLEQCIVAQELIVVDLRARMTPAYGMPQRREVEKFHVEINMPAETLRFAVPPINEIIDFDTEPRKVAELLPGSVIAGTTLPAAETPLPVLPPTVPSPTRNVAGQLGVVMPSDIEKSPPVSKDVPVDSAQPAAGSCPVDAPLSSQVDRDGAARKSVGWKERSICKRILGRVPRPYPPALRSNKFLADGTPAFDFCEIFGVLPEQVELSLEMDSTHRYGVPTRFVLDPTIDLNIIQLKTVDECVGPANQDGVKQRPIKELYVSWSSLKAVKVEWHTSRMLLRRWVDSETERNQMMEVPIQASVTNSRSIPVNVQILGAPFARQYVRSFVLFTDSEGAIAVQCAEEVEWWPFRSAVGLLR